ncbi:hypothetical protein [Streptomyces drozdowiczii]|nr:hypothetical protein [Streptomyces drozdowiczii]
MERTQTLRTTTITMPPQAAGDSDPDMDEALRRARDPRKAVA